MSVAIIALAVYLFMDMSVKNFYPPELVSRLETDMENADVEAAMQVAEASPTCLGQVVHGATEYIYERGYDTLDGETIYDLMADASQEFNRGRAQTINYLSVISQAAPMLGLLGTVSGMIKAFQSLGTSGMGNPKVLAANISEALWTTASGLVIALPAVFLYYFFRDKLTARVADVDKIASRMLNSLRRTVYAGTYEEQHEQVLEHQEQHPQQGHAPEGPPMG
jgi:biopolymer transport protein ExbB